MQNINDQIARSAEAALDLAEMAEMLDEHMKNAEVILATGVDLAHIEALVTGLRKFSAGLSRDLAALAA